MTRREAIERLFRGMRADVNDYQRLRDLLEAQFDAALHHRAEEIAGIAEGISRLTEQLESRRRERVELANLLVTDKRNGVSISAVSARLPEASRRVFNACWTTLESLVEECKQLNQRNCRLMTSQYEIMRRVLDAEADTYAPA